MIPSMSIRQQKKARATVTLDSELVGRVKRRVGERGVSSYLNTALRRELRHEAMREYLERAEREHGPIDPKVREAVRAAIQAGYEKVDRLRKRRGRISPLVKPVPPSTRRTPSDLVRRATEILEKAFGGPISVDAIGDDTLVVQFSGSRKHHQIK
jgi:Arc/MetJ family transcription regulator